MLFFLSKKKRKKIECCFIKVTYPLRSLICSNQVLSTSGISVWCLCLIIWEMHMKFFCFRGTFLFFSFPIVLKKCPLYCWESPILQVKAWAKLLNTFCTNGKLELELLYKVQIQCYEDAKLMKLFPEIVRSLYDQDVLAEDTILLWFRRGTNPKGRYACSLLCHLIHKTPF